jgi:hypothetical protein
MAREEEAPQPKPSATSNEWAREQREDSSCQAMMTWILDHKLPEDEIMKRWVLVQDDNYVMEEGKLMRVLTNAKGRKILSAIVVVVPKQKVESIVRLRHENPMMGAHQGVKKTWEKISRILPLLLTI